MKQALKKISLVVLFLSLIFINLHCSKKPKPGQTPPPPPPLAAPVLDSLDPADGIIGDSVSVKGKNLLKADQITFNGITSKIIQSTGSSITTVVPQGVAVGINKIAVHTTGGTSNEIQFEVLKEPDHVDSLPPTLSRVIPSSNFTDYPVLVYGDNLSGIIKITFNDKDAVIFTNNQKVVTTTVPKDLPSGPVEVKVRTLKGTSNIIHLQVEGPPPNGPAGINFSIINIPPPDYIPNISNNWTCGLFSTFYNNEDHNDHTFVKADSDTTGNGDYAVTGRYEYDFNKPANYNDANYVEIINHSTNDTLAGQFSSKFNSPCVFRMVLISSKTGIVDTCVFDYASNFPGLPCDGN